MKRDFSYLKICFYFIRNDAETSLRLREERLKRNEVIGKKVTDMKAKLNDPSLFNNNSSFLTLLMTKYRRPFFIGLFTLLTGSIFLFKFATTNDRTH
jgi:hypothetical protein